MSNDTDPGRAGKVTRSQLQSRAVEKARQVNHSWSQRRGTVYPPGSDSWRRETKVLPRKEARAFARAFLKRYPKAAYWSEVESWRVLEDDVIEFTMRRLPSAD